MLGRRARHKAKAGAKREAADRRVAATAMQRLRVSQTGGKVAAMVLANAHLKSTVDILEHVPEEVSRAMPVVDVPQVPWVPSDAEAVKLAVLQFQEGTYITPEQSTTVEDFISTFKTTSLYNTPGLGRGHGVVKTFVAQTPVCPVKLCTSRLRPTLTAIDTAHADALWHYACSHDRQSCGTEFLGLGSCKVQTVGQRRVLVVSVNGLRQFCKNGVSAGATVTMDHLVELLKTGDKTFAESLVAAHVEMYAHDLAAGGCVFVPWGFIVAERVLNSHDIGGFRWSLLSQHVAESSVDVAHRLLPADASKVPHGSSHGIPSQSPPGVVQTWFGKCPAAHG